MDFSGYHNKGKKMENCLCVYTVFLNFFNMKTYYIQLQVVWEELESILIHSFNKVRCNSEIIETKLLFLWETKNRYSCENDMISDKIKCD